VTPLHSTAWQGHLEVCRLIIENVQDKNPADEHKKTPLHFAVEEGHEKICRLIIENCQNLKIVKLGI